MEQNYNNNNNNGYNYSYENSTNNVNTTDNGGYAYAQQTQYIQPQPAPKKKGRFAKAAALVTAVAIIGGGAGFGGAYLARDLIGTNTGRVTASYSNAASSDSGNTSGNNSSDPAVSAALAAVSGSGDAEAADKVYPTSVTATGENGEYTLTELYEAVNDTIVLVEVYKKSSSSATDYYDYFFGYGGDSRRSSESSEPQLVGYGSGIVFTDDGYILTNAHVVSGADKLTVVVNDYNDPKVTYEYEATVVGSDDSTDIAVIKIERDEPFIAAKIGDSNTLKVGQQIAVIGNPGINATIMFAHSMTTGIVSALDVECLNDSGYSLSLIQTDAAINSGNSGGGMFDMYGNIVGVVNSKIVATTYEGIGFALTIDEAKPIMEDLLNYGYVKSRPVLGITTVELSEYRAQLYGTKLSQGMLVASINEDAPVAKSGLQVADIITKVNGVNVASLKDVQSILSKFKVGDTVTVTVARENSFGGVDSVDIDIELTEVSAKQ